MAVEQPNEEIIRREFGRLAEGFAQRAPDATVLAMLEAAGLTGTDRALDVATGAGLVAFALAARVSHVVGVDITPEMISKALERQQAESIANLEFQVANVTSLPFPEASFDLATCRMGIHHFVKPSAVVWAMASVLRRGGKVVLCDNLASEDPDKARLHNELECLRGPSHVKNLSETQLRSMMGGCGFRVTSVRYMPKDREFTEWMASSPREPEVQQAIRERLLESIPGDRMGLNVRLEGGELKFTYRQAVLVAHKEWHGGDELERMFAKREG